MLNMIKTPESPLIVAVSGGIDSVCLLHMLVTSQEPIIVAHVDHGIRDDSNKDEVLVRKLADTYKVPFVSTKLTLGRNTSEDKARTERYNWLEKVTKQYNARAIVTAHHQDDVLETIAINLIRGTSWRGLASLRETPKLLRPLLSMSKAEIVGYAITHNLTWNEDSTNESFRYLRNSIRSQIIPRLSSEQRSNFYALYRTQCGLRSEIESEAQLVVNKFTIDKALNRHLLTMIDDNVAIEILKVWLGETYETYRMSALLLFAKIAKPGDRWSIDANRYVQADKRRLIVLMPSD